MTAFNAVRFRVKPGRDEEFLDAHKKIKADWPGLQRVNMIKTGDRSYCIIAEWSDMDALAKARPNMIATLDTFRDTLEDLGGGLGVTDPVSGPVVLALKKLWPCRSPVGWVERSETHHSSRTINDGFRFALPILRLLLLGLGGEEQRIALALAELGSFLRLGVGDILGVDRDNAHAALVRRHHHAVGLVFVHAKDRLEHLHDEFARGVVVSEQNDLVKRW